MIFRTIVVGLVRNRKNELLFCKMNPNQGVFKGKWAFPGGGIEAGEKMADALRREMREELGVEVEDIQPAFFKDGTFKKKFPDGTEKEVYMIFLMFSCMAREERLSLNEEFIEYRWVPETGYDLLSLDNVTRETLQQLKDWKSHRGI